MNATVSAAISARIAKGQTTEEANEGVAKSLVIVAILSRVEQGASMQEAMDAVLGEGAYANLDGDVSSLMQ